MTVEQAETQLRVVVPTEEEEEVEIQAARKEIIPKNSTHSCLLVTI
jgi:hypothetical protein